LISFPELNALVSCETQRLKIYKSCGLKFIKKYGVTTVYTGQLYTVQYIKRLNPKSLTGDKVNSGIGFEVDSVIGLPVVNGLESTLEWTIR